MNNIVIVVSIAHRKHGCKCEIYAPLILIYLCIGNKLCCGRGGICGGMRP